MIIVADSSPIIALVRIGKLYLLEKLMADATSILLALEFKATLLADDLKVRQIAKEKNLTVIGTIGVLLRLHKKGLIKNLTKTINALIEKDFRISKELYEQIQKI